jgi:hypothetical protein
LTQDLLHRPPIERKLSDEQSSNRLDTILADGNSDCHQPHVSRFPCRCRWLVSRCASGPGPGNVPQGRSGDRGAVPPRRLVSALEAPIAVAGSLRRLPTRPKSNRARQKARQPASPRPRTRSSNPVPSSGESTNFRFPVTSAKVGPRYTTATTSPSPLISPRPDPGPCHERANDEALDAIKLSSWSAAKAPVYLCS